MPKIVYAAKDIRELLADEPDMEYLDDVGLSPFIRKAYEAFTKGWRSYRKRYAQLVHMEDGTGHFPPLAIEIEEKKFPSLERFIIRNKGKLAGKAANYIHDTLQDSLSRDSKVVLVFLGPGVDQEELDIPNTEEEETYLH